MRKVRIVQSSIHRRAVTLSRRSLSPTRRRRAIPGTGGAGVESAGYGGVHYGGSGNATQSGGIVKSLGDVKYGGRTSTASRQQVSQLTGDRATFPQALVAPAGSPNSEKRISGTGGVPDPEPEPPPPQLHIDAIENGVLLISSPQRMLCRARSRPAPDSGPYPPVGRLTVTRCPLRP
jgi:hypothetical protein